MIYYIDTETGEFPLTLQRIKEANKNVSFKIPFVSDRYKQIYPSPKPACDASTKICEQITPTLVNDRYIQSWEIVDRYSDYVNDEGATITKAEQEAESIAEAHNRLLYKKKYQLSKLREKQEHSGVTVGEKTIPTDEKTQAWLTRAFNIVTRNPTREVKYKKPNGEFISLNQAQIYAAFDAVDAHVQACNDREEELISALEADIETDITTGW